MRVRDAGTTSPRAVVVGGANMDIKARCRSSVTPGTSNPGVAGMSPGGVARNVAENLARLGTATHLVAVLGADHLGDEVLTTTARAGVHVGCVSRPARRTGTYTAVLDTEGELVIAVADMSAMEDLGPERLDECEDVVLGATVLVLDGNLRTDTLRHAIDLAARGGVDVVVDPVSVPKGRRLAPVLDGSRSIHTITPNRSELEALTGLPVGDDVEVRAAVDALRDRGVDNVWVRLGSRGSVLSTADAYRPLPAYPATVVDVTGAGDSMLAAYCHALLRGLSLEECAAHGHAAAALTIAVPDTVRRDLTDHLLRSVLR